jgi:hypothetical protein
MQCIVEDGIWLSMTLMTRHGADSRLDLVSERRQHPEAMMNSAVTMDTTDGWESLKIISVASEAAPMPMEIPIVGEGMKTAMTNTRKA